LKECYRNHLRREVSHLSTTSFTSCLKYLQIAYEP